ncbi:radical SAM protein [Paludibaculum fermentans]|uniref:Radical SAM protein n=1 Tax=Paludibaculum fermentans TaxID=1473598 RepID=A0A7S7NQN5_PALFE|nr:radical SAM protein [Paludibaculum fermentans]QOY87960.1 radical SAM protein [Paludibaculum fermentans]
MNWLAQRPIVVSFEVTDSCTCYCRHCDHGGPKDDSKNMRPADYRHYTETLKPCVVQVSGGEPLMREDLSDVVRSIKLANGLPYIILVSSWSLMTPQRYLELRDAGVDQFSVSLDFPDNRHDEFRMYPGLYSHLNDVIPACAAYGYDDIVLNTCITAANVGEINGAADQAHKWGVNICYSAYSARRTGCRELFPGAPEQLAVLNSQLDRIEKRRDESNWIVSAPTTVNATRHYFETGGAPGCKAGLRFLVVTADGMLQPCSMQFKRYKLEDQEKMVNEFTMHNQCDECYVAIRSNLDKNFPQLLRENVTNYLSFSRGTKAKPAGTGAGC